MEEKQDKKKLSEIYETYKKKFNLPEYENLIEDFEVDKVDSEDEKFLVRNCRRVIGEKINAYLHFFEVLINPSSPPVYIYTFLKNLDEKSKNSIKEIYKLLSKTQVKLMQLDTIYNEKLEAEFISKFFKDWQNSKKEIYEIMKSLENSFENNSEIGKRSYLG